MHQLVDGSKLPAGPARRPSRLARAFPRAGALLCALVGGGCHWLGDIDDRTLAGGGGSTPATTALTTTASGMSTGVGEPVGSTGPGGGDATSSGPSTTTGGDGGGGGTSIGTGGSGGSDGGAGGLGGGASGTGPGGTSGGGTGGSGGAGGGGCGDLPLDPTEVWVDAAAVGDGPGTLACPVSSITKGLELLGASRADSRTLHVAAGTYDASREVFPLQIEGPLTLAGAGRDVTHLTGVGLVDSLPGLDGQQLVTMVVASRAGEVELRDLSMDSDELLPDGTGAYCVDGNAPPDGSAPLEAAGFRVRDTSWRGFQYALTAYAAPSGGCFLDVRGSHFEENWTAVWSWGYGSDNLPAAVRVGGALPEDANSFVDQVGPDGYGCGVLLWDGTSFAAIEGNEFVDGQYGVIAGFHYSPPLPPYLPQVHILDNRFTRDDSTGPAFGVLFGGASLGTEVSGNWFEGLYQGLTVLTSPDWSSTTHVARGRDNVFRDNAIGVLLQGSTMLGDYTSDFGTAGDPGGNEFTCNQVGVWVDAPGEETLPFHGNAWDAVPVVVDVEPPVYVGTQVYRSSEAAATIELGGATLGRSCN